MKKELFIIPGWGGTKDTWKTFEIEAKKMFDYVEIVELPGFGLEECPDTVWGVEEYAIFCKKYLETCSREKGTKRILLAHSFGGQVAVELISKNSDLVDLLVLSGAAVYRPQKILKRFIFGQIAKMGKWIFSLPVFRSFESKARKVLYKAADSPDYSQTDGIKKQIFQKVIRQDKSHLLKTISVPTLLLWGEDDTYVSVKYGKQMNYAIPSSRLKIIKNGRHGIHLTHAKDMLHYINQYMSDKNI